jgi:hypothetical protein
MRLPSTVLAEWTGFAFVVYATDDTFSHALEPIIQLQRMDTVRGVRERCPGERKLELIASGMKLSRTGVRDKAVHGI